MTIFLVVLIALNIAMLVAGWRLFRRTARSVEASEGRAEREHSERWLREMEARERWSAIDLDALHPLNRDEVVGLLRRIDGASTRALTASERAFLDRMVEAERRATMRGSPAMIPRTKRAVTGP